MQIHDKASLVKVNKSDIKFVLSVIFFKIILDLSYYFVISPIWGYEGLQVNLNLFKLLESYFLLIPVMLLMPKNRYRLSSIFIWLLILISYIPMLTFYAFMDQPRIYMYAVTIFWILVFMLMRIKVPAIKKIKQSKIISYFIISVLLLYAVFVSILYFSTSFNFDLTQVYIVRSLYTATAIPLAGYLLNWAACIINPLLFAIFLIKKKWFPLILIILLQLVLFSGTGIRLYLFTLPFVLFIMWVASYRNGMTYLAVAFSLGILTGVLSYWLFDDKWLSALLTYRIFIDPARLSFNYYDFFSNHEFVLLSDSRIGPLLGLTYPYHLDPPHLIGEVYFHNPNANVNTGITGDAYMNFGLWGLLLLCIILSAVLKLIDVCSEGIDLRVGTAVIAIVALMLTNVGILTSLMTSGLLLAILLLYLLPVVKKQTHA